MAGEWIDATKDEFYLFIGPHNFSFAFTKHAWPYEGVYLDAQRRPVAKLRANDLGGHEYQLQAH